LRKDGFWQAVRQRGGFHGPTPPMRSGVILVTNPGGGSGMFGNTVRCTYTRDVGASPRPRPRSPAPYRKRRGTRADPTRSSWSTVRRARCEGRGGGPQLPLFRQRRKDDFLPINPDPGGHDVRSAILTQRDHVRDRVALEKLARRSDRVRSAHLHAPGSRTVHGKGGDFAIIGPGWQGRCPRRSPCSACPQTSRSSEAAPTPAARPTMPSCTLQDQFKLVPLSALGMDYTPPDDVPLKPSVEEAPVGRQVMAGGSSR
jgi:hypothetical protein